MVQPGARVTDRADGWRLGAYDTRRVWNERVKKAVHEGFVMDWEMRIESRPGEAAEWYRSVKHKWGREAYLENSGFGIAQARRYFAQMRMSTAPLAALQKLRQEH